MPIEPHLMDDEQVQEYCVTDQWGWVATDRRVVKYRESNDTVTGLHDISYGEISAVSMTTEPKSNMIGGIGAFATVSGLVLALGNPIFGFPVILVGLILIAYWYFSEETSYFEFRGGGLIEKEPEQWQLKADADSDDAREFVKAVRSQL